MSACLAKLGENCGHEIAIKGVRLVSNSFFFFFFFEENTDLTELDRDPFWEDDAEDAAREEGVTASHPPPICPGCLC